MTLSRTNVALGLTLVLLVALNVATTPERARRETARALFPSLEVEAVRELELAGAEGTLRIVRRQGAWVLPELGGFPAQAGAVEQLAGALGRLVELDAVGRVTGAEQAFGLGAEQALDVRLLGDGGRELCVFRQGAELGRGPGASGSLGSFVVPKGSERVVRAGRVPRLATEPAAWWDPRLFVAPIDRVGAFTLRVEGVERRIERGDAGWVWVDGERRVDLPPVLVEECLVATSFLVLRGVDPDVHPDEVGLERPATALEVRLDGNLVSGVAIGPDAGEDTLWATRLDWPRPFAAWVDRAALEELTGPGGAWQRLLEAIEVREDGP